MVRQSLHCLFKLDVRLRTGNYLNQLGDIVLQEVLVEGVSNLQPTDECKGGNFLLTAGDIGQLIQEEIKVRLQVVCLPQLTEKRWWLFLLASY